MSLSSAGDHGPRLLCATGEGTGYLGPDALRGLGEIARADAERSAWLASRCAGSRRQRTAEEWAAWRCHLRAVARRRRAERTVRATAEVRAAVLAAIDGGPAEQCSEGVAERVGLPTRRVGQVLWRLSQHGLVRRLGWRVAAPGQGYCRVWGPAAASRDSAGGA